jgi:hypothetical protein
VQRVALTGWKPTTVAWLGLVVTGACVALVLAVVGARYPVAVAPLVLGSILVAISLPALARQARREHSDALFWVLVAALVLKLLGSMLRYFVAFDVYHGFADAAGYSQEGIRISEAFRHGQFEIGLSSLTSTNFVRLLTGVVYTLIGPNILGGFLVFSWIGFWGLFLFYRAFTIGVPEGRVRSYARLVFFLPSMLFWPSSIGKEAWMMFALGIVAFGSARIFTGATVRGVVITALGLWLAAVVRPHIAGMMALALAGGYLLRRPRPELRQLAPLVKVFSLAVLALLAAVLVVRTDRFLQQSGIDTSGGANSVISAVTERTAAGSSAFAPPSIIQSPLRAPIGVASVLFRPFVTEANNLQSMATALEGTFLLVLLIVRIRWLFAALKSIRRQPYVAFALLYTGIFIVAYSSVANFGLLARQRVQLLPLYLVLFAVPRRKKEEMTVGVYEPTPSVTADRTRGAAFGGARDVAAIQVQQRIARVVQRLQASQTRTATLKTGLEPSHPIETLAPDQEATEPREPHEGSPPLGKASGAHAGVASSPEDIEQELRTVLARINSALPDPVRR